MSPPARARRADSEHTRCKILDVSEKLFSEQGYTGTSLRAIAEGAGVNLAAAHYHFGSKMDLLRATLARCVVPINSERLARLDALKQEQEQEQEQHHADSGQSPDLEAIVRAFVEPVFTAGQTPVLPALLARLFAEPPAISVPLLQDTFRPVVQRLQSALAQALPDLSPEEIGMRIHLIIGAMSHLARFSEPLDVFAGREPELRLATKSAVDQLVEFAVAGLEHRSRRGEVN